MSTTRRTDESFADFKIRQKQEAAAVKIARRTGFSLQDADNYRVIANKQIVTAGAIKAGNMRAAKYKMAATTAASLSNTQRKKLGLAAK